MASGDSAGETDSILIAIDEANTLFLSLLFEKGVAFAAVHATRLKVYVSGS